ncbi:uncharacterized protein [Musca autumnalis]|uniref:uncharacterized protein n=1 Tax=Musca autumnalis TaxID=221902 RepID=UPI003CF60848
MIPKNLIRSKQAFTNRCLRRIYVIYWPNTITNNALWNMSNQQPLEEEIKRKKYRWLGHTMRKASTDVTKQLIEYNPQGSRRIGRPKSTWRRQVESELKESRITWSEMKNLAMDRWKTFVTALCSSRN